MIKTSIVIPVYNEAPNLAPLYRQLVTLDEMAGVISYQSLAPFEIIVVDDGSTDDPLAVLQPLLDADPRLTVIQLRRNYGKTAALAHRTAQPSARN